MNKQNRIRKLMDDLRHEELQIRQCKKNSPFVLRRVWDNLERMIGNLREEGANLLVEAKEEERNEN